MDCTAKDEYGAFTCDCCLIDALIRCKKQNERAYQLWGQQLRRGNQVQYERIRLILKGEQK